MRIKGKEIKGKNVVDVVIPRGANVIAFQCQAVLDYTDFNSLCPEPLPPEVRRPGNVVAHNTKDKNYIAALEEYAKRRFAYIVIKSLEATEGLTWATVKLDDPNTWTKYAEELAGCDFNAIEIGRIVTGVLEANCLSEQLLEKARADFLATREQAQSE